MPQYKLHYFNFRGMAELTRLIFHYAGVAFEDVRFEKSEWPQLKASMPFGQVPVLEVDGKPLSQSYAIARYVARQHGLAGKDDWEQAQVDMYADCIKDFMILGRPVYEEHDPEKQKILMNKFMTDTMIPHMLVIEAQLAKNGGVLVGKDVTWADIACYAFFSFVISKNPDVLNDCPNITALLARVSSHENIKKYLETRPVTEI
ncbi:glutathione S-transferase 1-like [Daphnia carinata]|uniref:glutathione S-transferase 1-like n=1 Tax=Daphnia carinata TaxID=120202 RepID=UPI00257EA1B8|nr:glutathione S-transferase 1-like [Daphnia carinata]